MALKGTFYGTTTNERVKPKIEWSAVQSVEGNWSDVTATLYYSRTNNTSDVTAGAWVGSITIDGVTKKENKRLSIAYNSNTLAITHTVRVHHEENGEKSLTISATGGISISSMKSTSISAKVTLDTILRASNISRAAAVELGKACDVRWIPNSSAFRFKLKFSLGGWEHTTEAIHPDKTSTHTYTDYTIPLAVAEQITGDDEATMTVTLTTYADSSCNTAIGSHSEAFKVNVPQNADTQPIVTMELTPVKALNGLYIQGQSKVQAELSATPKLKAKIESYSMKVDGNSYDKAPYLSNALTKAGDIEITGCAVDSRGIPGYTKQAITVLPYFAPKLIGAEAYRCTSAGVPADNGEYLKIEATRDYEPVTVDGVQHNFCKIQYIYKAENAEDFSEPITILTEDAQDDAVATEPLLNATFRKDTAYTVKIVAIDTVGQSHTVTKQIPSEFIFRHKRSGGKGVGYGGYCEQDNTMDVYWDIKARKSVNGMYVARAPYNTELKTITIQTKYTLDLEASSPNQSFLIFGAVAAAPIFGMLLVNSSLAAQWTGQGTVSCEMDENDNLVVTLPEVRNDSLMILSADVFNIIE